MSKRKDQWTEEDVSMVLANPLHAVMGVVSEEQYKEAVKIIVETEGLDHYLDHMLKCLKDAV